MGYRKLCVVLLVFFTILSTITGCLKIPEEKKTVDLIVKTRGSDFWQTVRDGAKAAGKEFNVNVRFYGPDDEEDIDEQIKIMEESIKRKPSSIVLSACDYNKLVEVTEKAINKGIPVIIIDSALNSDKVSSFISTDNVDAGYKIGGKVAEIIGKRGKVGIINFVKGSAPADQRKEGLLKALQKYHGIEIADIKYCNSDIETARLLTSEIINEHKDIDALIGLNAQSTIGAAKAIKSKNVDKCIKLFGFDCTLQQAELIEKGILDLTIVQNPYAMGYLGVKYAIDVVDKKIVPARTYTNSTIIDKDNMYLIENQKLLFPFTE